VKPGRAPAHRRPPARSPPPMDIHIMQKERVCYTFEASMMDETHVEFLGCEFECPRVDMSDSSRDWKNVKVEVDFDKVILQDNEEDGMLTGEVKFILYKGNHYHRPTHH
jgi:spermidine/putrescine transport system ATP-binding protein